MPTEPLDVEQVTAHVATVTGLQVLGVQPLPGSVANQDFRVRLADDSAVVVKIGPRSEMVAEAWSCRHLTGLGLPVPGVVALDPGGAAGPGTLVLTVVAGAPSESPAVAFQAGQCMRQVHGQELPGWGTLTVEDDTGSAHGSFGTWADAVRAELEGLPELVGARVLDADLAASARSCVLTEDLLSYDGPGVLLHRDLKPAHLFGVDGDRRLSAIIDWGDAHVGDPAADLARLSMAGPAITEAFLAGYGLEPSPALADRLARYRVLWDVAALAYEFRAGGDWFDVYRDRLRSDTGRLTG